MSINYTQYELLELFDNETIINEALKKIEYTIVSKKNFLLTLYVSKLENYVQIKLEYKNLDTPLFDIELIDIIKITTAENKLDFYKKGSEAPCFRLYIKPNITFKHNIE